MSKNDQQRYLEMSEDAMVEWLVDMQKLARVLLKTGAAKPYSKIAHNIAVQATLDKMTSLANSGDII